MSGIRTTLDEIKNINDKLDKMKTLRQRKKELSEIVIEYIRKNKNNNYNPDLHNTGIRVENTLFIVTEKKKTTRRNKDDIYNDILNLLKHDGIQGETILELEKIWKGEVMLFLKLSKA